VRTPSPPSRPTPRVAPFDVAPYDVPVAAPFLLDLVIGPDLMSDVVEHVTNVEYVRWLDQAAEAHADAAGFTRPLLLERGLMWFVARHEIDYLAEAWLGDELVIATWVRDVARVRSWRDYVVVRPRDGQVICRAATLWVLVDLATRRPTRIPPDMAGWLDRALG
jgi:acyl-CoA thioester hydrolase